MARKDLLLDDDYNIKTADGDFVSGDSDEQHVELLANSAPCMFKEFPGTGAGLLRFVKSQASPSQIRRELDVQLQADGYRLTKFERDENGEYQIDWKTGNA